MDRQFEIVGLALRRSFPGGEAVPSDLRILARRGERRKTLKFPAGMVLAGDMKTAGEDILRRFPPGTTVVAWWDKKTKELIISMSSSSTGTRGSAKLGDLPQVQAAQKKAWRQGKRRAG